MHRTAVPSLALLALVASLAAANLLVTLPADAEGDAADPAPQVIPLNLALTGDSLGLPQAIAGLDARLVVAKEGPEIHLRNATDALVELELDARTTLSSGNQVSRMGPMTTTYTPERVRLVLQPGELIAWTLDTTEGEMSPGLGRPFARPEGVRARRVSASERTRALERWVEPKQASAASNDRVLLHSRLDFSSWTVSLTSHDETILLSAENS